LYGLKWLNAREREGEVERNGAVRLLVLAICSLLLLVSLMQVQLSFMSYALVDRDK
jgi:hypothetical protein